MSREHRSRIVPDLRDIKPFDVKVRTDYANRHANTRLMERFNGYVGSVSILICLRTPWGKVSAVISRRSSDIFKFVMFEVDN